MASSTTDTKGITNILLANAKTTLIQAIAELYHNSDDAKATKVELYKTSINNKTWLYFGDNGIGMDINDIDNYLKLFSTKRSLTNSQKHGKFSFGGKQAIMFLAGLKNENNNNYVIIMTKKSNCEPVTCCIKISDLQRDGWDGCIKAKVINRDDMTGIETKVLDSLKCIDNSDYTGTNIFIQLSYPNLYVNNIFEENNQYNLSINFYKRLETCELWIGNTINNIKKINMHDPLYIESKYINKKYNKYIDDDNFVVDEIDIYKDNKYNRYLFVIDGVNLPYVNIKGDTKKDWRKFIKSNDCKKITTIQIEFNMVLSIFYKKHIINGKKKFIPDKTKEEKLRTEEGIYLCRNGVIVGKYPQLGISKARRTAYFEQYNDWTRTRINIIGDNKLDNEIDNIFGINLNKLDIQWNSVPKVLQKTIKLITEEYWDIIKFDMKEDYDSKYIKPIIPKIRIPRRRKTRNSPKPFNPPKPVNPPKPPKPFNLPISPNSERHYQLLLQQREGGNTEENLGGMRADLITDNHVIEIKNYNKRIEGLKVLWYLSWYDDKKIKPRIHIINHDGKRCGHLKNVCEKYKIDLSYEVDDDSIYEVNNIYSDNGSESESDSDNGSESDSDNGSESDSDNDKEIVSDSDNEFEKEIVSASESDNDKKVNTMNNNKLRVVKKSRS